MKFLIRFMLQLGVLVLMSIPLDIYLFAKYILVPSGIWQNLVLPRFGISFLGAFQLIFIVGGIALSFSIWITAMPEKSVVHGRQ